MLESIHLPTVNACLNTLAGILLFFGRRAIKRGDRALHKKIMIGAFSVSAVFLVSYLYYHYHTGHTEFPGTGAIKAVYLIILIPHIILAGTMVPFIIALLVCAFRGRFEGHRKLARWVWPVWMFVSITGVVVYLMLYQLY